MQLVQKRGWYGPHPKQKIFFAEITNADHKLSKNYFIKISCVLVELWTFFYFVFFSMFFAKKESLLAKAIIPGLQFFKLSLNLNLLIFLYLASLLMLVSLCCMLPINCMLSINCLVHVSSTPQCRIKKSDIFEAEKWSFNNCQHLVIKGGQAHFFMQPFVTVHFPAINFLIVTDYFLIVI